MRYFSFIRKLDELNFFFPLHLSIRSASLFIYLCLLVLFIFYLSARFDASRAHASALVHFTEVHSFLVVYRPVNLTVFSVSKRRRKRKIRFMASNTTRIIVQ
jgi:hypothetical protein